MYSIISSLRSDKSDSSPTTRVEVFSDLFYKIDENKMPIAEEAKNWPANNKMADFESIANPLREALQVAINRGDKVYEEGIDWTGLKQGSKNRAIVFQPAMALHSINLKYSNKEQGRDVFTEILNIAVQLGIEQGRREIISSLKEVSFMFTSKTGKEIIKKIVE